MKFKSEVLLTGTNLELPDVGVRDDLVAVIVFNTAVHEVAVLADVGERVSGTGMRHLLTLLFEFFPLELVGLSRQT